MEKPLLILKPSIINALLPTFLKNLFYVAIPVLPLYWFSIIIEKTSHIQFSHNNIFWVIILLLILSISPLIVKIIILSNTNYYFFKTHVLKEFKFFIIKNQSVLYNKITNISTNISIWDRMCNAGDITLHTAEDREPDLILSFIKEPLKLEKSIYKLYTNK